jgi:hypothetical protein
MESIAAKAHKSAVSFKIRREKQNSLAINVYETVKIQPVPCCQL